MPPEIGPQTGGDYKEEGGGGFFSKKVGPLPMWAIIAAGIIILYVLYTKYFANTQSSSNPAVTSNPSTDTTSGTFPWDNLTSALAQVQANEQGISAQLTQPANPSTTNLPVNPMPVQTSAGSYAGWGGAPPTAPPNYSASDAAGTGTTPGGGTQQITPTSARGNPAPVQVTLTVPPKNPTPSWLPKWVPTPPSAKPTTFTTPYVSAPALNQYNPMTPYGRGN